MAVVSIVDLASESLHLPTLAAWHHAQWLDLNPGDTLESRITRMQAYLGPDLIPSTFVYKVGQKTAGSAALVACDMETRPELSPWLASVFVAPEFRRQGIGAALVRHVMAQAKQANFERVYLFTPDRSDFYRKLGWRNLFTESYRGHFVTVMAVELS